MIAQRSGLIVNISSVGAIRYVFNVAYGVGKAGVDKLAAESITMGMASPCVFGRTSGTAIPPHALRGRQERLAPVRVPGGRSPPQPLHVLRIVVIYMKPDVFAGPT